MKILLVDEEKASISYYVGQLEDEGMAVTHCRNPDTALAQIQARLPRFDFVILDSAMPPGKAYETEKTDSGTSTGGLLFRDIRLKCPDIPVLVLTNFSSLDWIRDAARLPNVKAALKLDVTPTKLVQIVRQMIKESKKG